MFHDLIMYVSSLIGWAFLALFQAFIGGLILKNLLKFLDGIYLDYFECCKIFYSIILYTLIVEFLFVSIADFYNNEKLIVYFTPIITFITFNISQYFVYLSKFKKTKRNLIVKITLIFTLISLPFIVVGCPMLLD